MLIIFFVLMFIGCSFSFVGGGVWIMIVVIIGLYLLVFLKSEDDISVFSCKIDDDDVKKLIVVFMLFLIMCFFVVVFLLVIENLFLILIIVEVVFVFGIIGFFLGIIDDLIIVGKLMIVLLMFIGCIGMFYILMIFVLKEICDLGYEYFLEKIIIG